MLSKLTIYYYTQNICNACAFIGIYSYFYHFLSLLLGIGTLARYCVILYALTTGLYGFLIK